MSAEAVGQFCQAIGLPAQALPLVLNFEHSGTMYFEEADSTIVIYLTREVPLHRTGVALAALQAVNPDRGLPYTVHAAFDGEDKLVLLVRLPSTSVDPSMLETVVQLLCRIADEALSVSG